MSSLSEHRLIRSRVRSSDATERGSSLIGLLIVVLALGLMAAVTLGSLGYTPNAAMTGVPLTMPGGGAVFASTSTSAVATSPLNYANAAAVAACRADFAVLSAAVKNYESSNGSLPPAGTAWAQTAVNGVPLIRAWPRGDHYFTIVWNGTTLSVTPAKGIAAHDSMGTRSPPTGCFAA
jgi:hypothetical protein